MKLNQLRDEIFRLLDPAYDAAALTSLAADLVGERDPRSGVIAALARDRAALVHATLQRLEVASAPSRRAPKRKPKRKGKMRRG
jgi:hypothetical protein